MSGIVDESKNTTDMGECTITEMSDSVDLVTVEACVSLRATEVIHDGKESDA